MRHRRSPWFALAAGAAGAALACSQPTAPGGVRVTTSRRTYAAGDTVVVTMTNVRGADVVYNGCSRALERRAAAGWEVAAAFPANGLCLAVGYTLPRGAAETLWQPLPAALPPGEYRVRFRDIGGAATNVFAVS